MPWQVHGDAEGPISKRRHHPSPVGGRTHKAMQEENRERPAVARDLIVQINWQRHVVRPVEYPSPPLYSGRHLFENPAVQCHVLLAVSLHFDQGRRTTGASFTIRLDEILRRSRTLVAEAEHPCRRLESYALRRAEVRLEQLLVPGDRKEGEDTAAIVVEHHDDGVNVPQHGEGVEVVQQREVPDKERDGSPEAPRKACCCGDGAVYPARAPIGGDGDGCAVGRREGV